MCLLIRDATVVGYFIAVVKTEQEYCHQKSGTVLRIELPLF